MARWFTLWSALLMSLYALPVQAEGGARAAASAVALAAAGTQSAALELDATDRYRLALLRMKGHLSVARALLQIGVPGVGHHLQEPMQDIFGEIEAELEERGAPFTADVLEQLEHATRGEAVTALATIEIAVTAINGSIAQTGALETGSALDLAEGLLRQAVANYEAAVIENAVVELRSYQSGRGFVTEAEALVRYSSGLKGRPGHDALLRSVVLIRQAWPGIVPPPIVFNPQDVASRLEEAVAVMDELR
ncbi:MAG: hypothetical protein ACFCUQ_14460 [Kiloniellales bacterium]